MKILPPSLADTRHFRMLTNTQQRGRDLPNSFPHMFPELHHLFFATAHLHATPVSQKQSNAKTRKTNFNCMVLTLIHVSHFTHGGSLKCSHKTGSEVSTEKNERKLGSL